jgi:hypothetical protein
MKLRAHLALHEMWIGCRWFTRAVLFSYGTQRELVVDIHPLPCLELHIVVPL